MRLLIQLMAVPVPRQRLEPRVTPRMASYTDLDRVTPMAVRSGAW